tara:strand:- start:792 stop:1535 length:744 start_codon:yes stop_codon:yes gene_type:complete
MSELVQENVQEQALEGSETSENNVISESEYQEDVSSDEVGQEDESRKFQSMYDKSEAELAKLRPVAQLFQDNPELVDVVRNHLSGGKEQEKEQVKLTEEEFNPWDAYTNPNSPSYQLRKSEIETAVQSRMDDYMSRLDAQRAVDNLQYRAQSDFNLSREEAEQFVDFVTKPKEQLPLDTLFNVWNVKNGKQLKEANNIKSVKNTQQKPKSAGLIQGGEPPKPSDEDNMWNNIMNASSHNSIGRSIKK